MTEKELDALEEEVQDTVNTSCGLIRGGWVDRAGEWDTGEARPPMVYLTTAEGLHAEMEPGEFRSYVSAYEEMVRHLFGRESKELSDLQELCAPLRDVLAKAVTADQEQRTVDRIRRELGSGDRKQTDSATEAR